MIFNERLERLFRVIPMEIGEYENIYEDEDQLLNKINDKYNEIKDYLPEPININDSELKKLKESNRDKCIICLEEFEINIEMLFLPCTHAYHKNYILKWFLRDSTCPTCKRDYKNFDNELNIIPHNDNASFINNQNNIHSLQLENNNIHNNSLFEFDNNLNNNIISEYNRGNLEEREEITEEKNEDKKFI